MGRWSGRLVRLACIAVAVALAMTCVRTHTEECPNGALCSEGRSCFQVDSSDWRCVTQDQLSACDESDAACVATGGACRGLADTACFIPVCGDRAVDPPEVCDDGDRADGGGCSASCLSREECGNQIVDLIAGEQCDDAMRTLAGDGCTFACRAEYRTWRDVTPGRPPSRVSYGVAVDPLEGILLFGGAGGDSIDTTLGGGAAFNDGWRWSGASWLEAPAYAAGPRRARVAIAYDPAKRRVVMAGGIDPQRARVAETWLWDGITWTRATPGTSFTARSDAALACSPQRCVMVGGGAGSAGVAPTLLNDTWTWDGETWTSQGAGPPAQAPRSNAVLVYHAGDQRMILFGGDGSGGGLADTWQLPDGLNTWSPVVSIANPLPRLGMSAHPSAAYNPVAKKIVLVARGTTWTYDDTDKWEMTNQLLNAPFPALAWSPERQRIVAISRSLTGGMETHELGPAGWSPVAELAPRGGAHHIAATYDPRRGRAIVIDGSGSGTTLEWTGVGWRSAAPPGFANRYGVVLVHDEGCGVTYAFGGAPSQVGLATDEMWAFANNAWTRVIGTMPPARVGHAMAYDAANDRIVLFGGRTAMTNLDDLWVWSGACGARAWTQISQSGTGPAGRSGATLVADRARDRLVLFGGVALPDTLLGDTWELAGDAWSEVTPAWSPAPRMEHVAAFDPRRERVVVFGGRSDDGAMSDTWEWTGGSWADVPTVLSTSARVAGVAVRDITGGLVLVGGDGAQAEAIRSIARLRAELGSEVTERCLTDVDDDGDGLAGCSDPDCWSRCEPLCRYGESCNGPRCGDGACSLVEDFGICAADCPPPP